MIDNLYEVQCWKSTLSHTADLHYFPTVNVQYVPEPMKE